MDQLNDSWWVVPAQRPGARVRLFCFPYAGGSAPVYHKLARALPDDIEVHCLQPPGRGFRLREPALTELHALVAAIDGVLAPRLDRPFALFGHSMGALVAFELTRRLRAGGGPQPGHLFASAAPAPQVARPRLVSTALEAPAFWAAVNQLYGTPAQAAVDPALLELAVPPLKDDFRILLGYRYQPGPPLAQPITAFIGSADPMVERSGAEAWREQTTSVFALHDIPGPHLYLRDAPPPLPALVTAALAGLGVPLDDP
jgi:medium-chain acyl-[acyl-carrier-protein] hydrolase